jgi:hypothetical protein
MTTQLPVAFRQDAASSAELPILGDSSGRRTALLLVGMHRSGTSALTRVLSLCGAALPKNLLPPSRANELGHWEPQLAVQAHDDFLAHIGSSWDDLRPWSLPEAAPQESERLAQQLRQLVLDEYGDAPLFVVKDPRLSRLLPIWRRVLTDLDVDVRVVISLREPLEVARSLQARDGTDIRRSLLLWLRDMLSAEKHSRGVPRCVVAYDALLDDWVSVYATLSARTGVQFPRLTAEAAGHIAAFLRRDQRHHTVGSEADEQQLVPLIIRQAADLFRAAARDGEPDVSALQEIEDILDVAVELYGGLLTESAHQTDLWRREAESARGDLDAARGELTRAAGDLARLGNDVTRMQVEISALRAALQASDTRGNGLEMVAQRASAMESSLSWRLTHPVRDVAARFPTAAHAIRSGLLAIVRPEPRQRAAAASARAQATAADDRET